MKRSKKQVVRRRPVQARSQDKVERIVAAARKIVERDGSAGFNTNRIAREAGVGVGTLYEYFPDKQAVVARLIDELAEHEGQTVLERIADLRDRPLEVLVSEVVAVTYQLYKAHRGTYRLLWAMSEVAQDVGSRPAERTIVAEVKTRLAPHVEALGIRNLDLACFSVFHLVESLVARMVELGGEWEDEAKTREIIRAVSGYLGLSPNLGVNRQHGSGGDLQ